MGVGVEEAVVLVHGEAIGHAGDVVGDRALLGLALRALAARAAGSWRGSAA